MEGHIADLWRQALVTVAMVGAPFIVSALVVGLTTSLIQAATQLQENVLSFAPKIAVVGVVLSLAGPWVLSRLTLFAATLLLSAAKGLEDGTGLRMSQVLAEVFPDSEGIRTLSSIRSSWSP